LDLGVDPKKVGVILGSMSAELGPFHSRKGAFSLIEMVVVIAVLTILAGLMLPALGGAIEQSRLTRMMQQTAQDAALVTAWAHDHDDAYPIAEQYAIAAAHDWYKPLVSGGYLRSAREADPLTVGKNDVVAIKLSMCMVYDPKYMERGHTLPPDDAPSGEIRQYQVRFPSGKGMMLQVWKSPEPPYGAFCCAGPLVEMPVAFADGSVISGTRLDFSRNTPIEVIDMIGMPVFSTWGGVHSRDR
jgi:prepilin-type N-terminal cleavage/methylation domain-containing protein